jgi:putative sigma-54 modulation protein
VRWSLDQEARLGFILVVAFVREDEDDKTTNKEIWVHIEIAIRHGELEPEQHRYIHDKAEKLLKYFGRLMAIEVAVDHSKYTWEVEILVSAEHKHDFVARETGSTPEAAMDLCVHKIERQLRRYKERVQHHKGDGTHGTPPGWSSEYSQTPEAAEGDSDEV